MKKHAEMLRSTSLAILAMAALLSLGASPVLAQKEESKKNKADYAALSKVPGKVQAKRNPFEIDPDAIAAGSKLFGQHCMECHGKKAEGTPRGADLRTEEVQQATPGALFWILTNGVVRRGMPVWSKLPEAQRWQIVTFLTSFSRAGTQPSHRN